MDIINNFCKTKNLKIIDISRLDFEGMLKMMNNVLKKNNVILVIEHNRCSKKVNNIFEYNEKVSNYNNYRLIYKEDFMRIHKNSLTDRLLNRWFKDLGGGTINETCPICLDCCKKENICCPTCLNVYHRDCLIKNVVNTGKNICPVCQSLIISDVVGYIVKDDILNIPVSV